MDRQKKDVASTFLNLFCRLLSGPAILILVPLFLTETQQGYWFLFGSVAALNTLADLGFSNIVLQFSAHEYAFLRRDSSGILVGEIQHIQKLGSFFRFVVRWLSVICAFSYPAIFIIGTCFLARDGAVLTYLLPWFIFSFGSLVDFFNNSVLSFLEGMNEIARIQRARMFVSLINTTVIALGLFGGIRIYALSFAMLLSSSFMFFTIFMTFGKTIAQIWRESKTFSYPWRKEILPLFRKYILSFASGYFLFQIYTPLMHYFHGPVMSGKVGISINIAIAIFSLSNIWVYTITPQVNMFVEKREWNSLDALFRKRLALSLISYAFICVCLFVTVFLIRDVPIAMRIFERFLPFNAILFIIISYFFQLIINAWAVYLRGHKQEPFWWTSIVSAVWTFVITLLAGKFLSVNFFFVGLLSGYVWGTPLCYVIYKKCRRKWHYE